MKRMRWVLSLLLVGFLVAAPALAQQDTTKVRPKRHGIHFVDQNGDGINDNAPCHAGGTALDREWDKVEGAQCKPTQKAPWWWI